MLAINLNVLITIIIFFNLVEQLQSDNTPNPFTRQFFMPTKQRAPEMRTRLNAKSGDHKQQQQQQFKTVTMNGAFLPRLTNVDPKNLHSPFVKVSPRPFVISPRVSLPRPSPKLAQIHPPLREHSSSVESNLAEMTRKRDEFFKKQRKELQMMRQNTEQEKRRLEVERQSILEERRHHERQPPTNHRGRDQQRLRQLARERTFSMAPTFGTRQPVPMATPRTNRPTPPPVTTAPLPPATAAPPGQLPPSDKVIDQLNNALDFMDVAHRLRLREQFSRQKPTPKRHPARRNAPEQPKSAYLREWRDKYLVDMGKVFGRKRSQPRNMLSRHKYEALLDRVKVVERIRREDGQVPAHLAVIGEKYRIVRKKSANDELAKDLLAEKGTGRMLLSVDDLFEVLHKYHLITGHGRSISMYNVARKKYANITVECILIFLVGCLECKKWNKNERKLATLLRPNQHKERRIDYACFYQFGAEAISCRHCFYRRSIETPGKPTNALRSHLKKYHLEVLEEYRTRILAATDGGTMAKTDNEIGQNGQIDQNGEIEQNGEINQNGEIEQNGPKTPSEQNTDLES
uniref:Uncharacterized protein n=1 Tax=Globodera rostochiensis TaxID=31243 RepID=A0A914HUD8_GLORO